MSEITRPAANAATITKSNSTTYSGIRALYIGGAGNVALKFPGNATAVTFVAVPAGSILPLQPVQIMSTNTTATDIVALY